MTDDLEMPMTNFVEVQRECIRRVEQSVETINRKLGLSLNMPQIRFSIKGTTAGRAHIGKNLIEFNPALLRTNVDDFLNRTPAHEVAHLAAYAKFGYGIKPHGEEWGRCCWCLGIPSTRCHNYDIPGRTQQKHQLVKHTVNGSERVIGIGKVIEFD